MKMVLRALNLLIPLDENKVDVIVVENPKVLYEIISSTILDTENAYRLTLIDDDGAAIANSKYEIVTSPFTINLNSKKLLNKLYKDFEETICTDLYEEYQVINSKIISLIEAAIFKIPYDISYNYIIDIKELIKICNISFEENHTNILERITDYIKLQAKVLELKCIIFINLHDFLSPEDLTLFYKEAFYYKINIVMVEAHAREKIENERIHVIDESECLIEY